MARETYRNSRGLTVSALVVLLCMLVVAPISMFSFEFGRYWLAKQQLKTCVDSCALAGAATNASSDQDPLGTQMSAMETALNMFKQNDVIGTPLTNSAQATSVPMSPAADSALLYFEFLNPTTRAPVALGDVTGKIFRVTASYGFTPALGKYAGIIGVFPIVETSNGGLPQLDVILCFDISSSMDDFTLISAVDRYNNSGTNGYNIIAQGPLYSALGCTNATGSPVNATFPQNLDASGGTASTYRFSGSLRGTNSGAAPTGATSSSFTDVVVNIDGTNTCSAGTIVTYNNTTYPFPAGYVGCLVEAARGNLESTTVAAAAHVPYTTWGITPKAGYYAAYKQAAFAQRHPISDAIAAATSFFSLMNVDCDVHFGLVTFSSQAGTSQNSTVPADYSGLSNICDNPGSYSSNAYPSDPYSPLPPNPTVPLIPTAGPAYSNCSTVSSAVQSLVAYGGTNISGALYQAIKQMKTSAQGGSGLSRVGATKAIVLFTDGLPTSSSTGSSPLQDARAQASAANAAGIPIYCIGLCLVPSLQSAQTDILTDTTTSPSGGGIAGISGNGAKFYQATDVSQINSLFQNVARALTQLVR